MLSTQKSDSHPILVDYGDDIHSVFKTKVILYTSLDSCSFQSVSSCLNKYKKPTKIIVKTLLQQNPPLSETYLYEDNDTDKERVPQPDSQQIETSHFINTSLPEIQNHPYNDSHLFEIL